jgi:hypothetical protein
VYTKADDRSAACKTEISADFGINVEPQADSEASTRSNADDPRATRAEINAEPVPDVKPQRDGASSAAPEDRSSKVTDAGVELPNRVGRDVGVEPATGAEPTVGCGWPDRRQMIRDGTVAGPVAVPVKTGGGYPLRKVEAPKSLRQPTRWLPGRWACGWAHRKDSGYAHIPRRRTGPQIPESWTCTKKDQKYAVAEDITLFRCG